jgi:5-dehydro-4-deoxyglucarate dehydratase
MMKPEDLREKLKGVIAFPVTPFQANLDLDIDGLRRNLRVLMRHPIGAVVAPAGTGEVFSLTPQEHRDVVQATLEEVNGKAPVLAAAGFNIPLATELAQQSCRQGVDGILAFPPYYPGAEEEGLADYYAAIGKATPLGMIVYSRDWVNPTAGGVDRIASKIPTLVAWKDGQGDLRRLSQIMARLGNRLHWIGGVGDDNIQGYYSLGIRTYTSSIANVSPRMAWTLHEKAAAADFAGLAPLMKDFVLPLYAFRARRKGYEVSVMKEMMMALGMSGGPVRPPLARMKPEEIEELRKFTESWKAWL